METNQYLINFYNSYDEDNRLKLRHGTVEFLTTMHYIEKYLKHGDHILEIGAGTGQYSHALARRGYAVDAVTIFYKGIMPSEKVLDFPVDCNTLTGSVNL